MAKKQYICTMCKSVGYPKQVTPGSIWIEILLWLLMIVPGLLYSIWRLISRKEVCSQCGNPTLIPLDTPAGRELATNKQ